MHFCLKEVLFMEKHEFSNSSNGNVYNVNGDLVIQNGDHATHANTNSKNTQGDHSLFAVSEEPNTATNEKASTQKKSMCIRFKEWLRRDNHWLATILATIIVAILAPVLSSIIQNYIFRAVELDEPQLKSKIINGVFYEKEQQFKFFVPEEVAVCRYSPRLDSEELSKSAKPGDEIKTNYALFYFDREEKIPWPTSVPETISTSPPESIPPSPPKATFVPTPATDSGVSISPSPSPSHGRYGHLTGDKKMFESPDASGQLLLVLDAFMGIYAPDPTDVVNGFISVEATMHDGKKIKGFVLAENIDWKDEQP
jgi:hypothetical protein